MIFLKKGTIYAQYSKSGDLVLQFQNYNVYYLFLDIKVSKNTTHPHNCVSGLILIFVNGNKILTTFKIRD